MPGSAGTANASRVSALNRALAAKDQLIVAAAGTGVDWTTLAAIGIRETGFVNKAQSGGQGMGIFQIDLGVFGNVSQDQAKDLAWAAHFAAQLLTSNRATIASATGITSNSDLNLMMISSYNTGAGGQISRYFGGTDADYHTSPMGSGEYRGDYGRNVLAVKDCFK